MLRSFGIRSEPSSRRKLVFIKCPIRFCTYDAACASLGAVLDSLGEHLAATAAFFRRSLPRCAAPSCSATLSRPSLRRTSLRSHVPCAPSSAPLGGKGNAALPRSHSGAARARCTRVRCKTSAACRFLEVRATSRRFHRPALQRLSHSASASAVLRSEQDFLQHRYSNP